MPTARDPRTHDSDTREEIRRHDPEHERKKGEHKSFTEDKQLFGDDQTEVSVQSLEAFLPMLLRNYTAKDVEADHVSVDKIDQTNPNARAAGAYARMAQYSPVDNLRQKVQETEEAREVKEEATDPTLSNEEVQAIHRLQADVAKLKAKGVQVILINKAGTFLESLQNGVKDALS